MLLESGCRTYFWGMACVRKKIASPALVIIIVKINEAIKYNLSNLIFFYYITISFTVSVTRTSFVRACRAQFGREMFLFTDIYV